MRPSLRCLNAACNAFSALTARYSVIRTSRPANADEPTLTAFALRTCSVTRLKSWLGTAMTTECGK